MRKLKKNKESELDIVHVSEFIKRIVPNLPILIWIATAFTNAASLQYLSRQPYKKCMLVLEIRVKYKYILL
jgi:hypothetical protein